ncbi:MAG: phage holin family protein [Pseudonocardia sp.]
MAILIRIAVVAVSLWLATLLVDGIELGAGTTAARVGTLVAVAIIFGVVNEFVKPVIKIFGCPLYILTLGLFGLVVNALLFMLVGWIAGLFNLPFIVEGFWPAFWGAIVVAVVSFVLHLVIPDRIDQR